MSGAGTSGPRSSGYDAFISYPRTQPGDVGDPRLITVAADLQRALRRVERPWYRRSRLRVFRDQASLGSPDWARSEIETALLDSDWLILLVWPGMDVAWVRMEVDWWLPHRGAGTILPVLVEGDLRWDRAAGRFDPAVSWPRLAAMFAREPLWIDLRPGGAGTASRSWAARVDDAAGAVVARIRARQADRIQAV